MDYIYMERGVAARACNNQLKMERALFSWAVQKCYCKENPFELIKTKKQEEKKRVLIPIDTRKKIREYLEQHNPNFLIVLELVFKYCMTHLYRTYKLCPREIYTFTLMEK